jgi:hypothetical protein
MAAIFTCTVFPFRGVRVRALGEPVELHLLVLDQRRRERLRVVRLADRREVEQHLHLVAGDVDQLG